MQPAPFISVIVPAHNRQKPLQALLARLEQQDYPTDRFEIIVVDDGSTDGTADLLRQSAAESRLQLLRQARQGPGAARNAGAQIARGEVLAFTDSDCLPEPGWLSALARACEPPVAAAGGQVENLDSGAWLRKFQHARGVDHIANHHPSPLYLDTANASFLKDVFWQAGGFNPAYTWSEDVDLGLRLRRMGFRLTTAPEAVVWHTGPVSLWAYLQRSRRIGCARGQLAADHPEVFYPPPAGGWRLRLRGWLDGHQEHPGWLAWRLSQLVQCLTWEKRFWLHELPGQMHRFRQQRLSLPVRLAYLGLEWLCHLAQLWGLMAYYRRSRPGSHPEEAHARPA
jgi:glycosyltransferase involved in cell wall biosynthesis